MTETQQLILAGNALEDCPAWWKNFMCERDICGWDEVRANLRLQNATIETLDHLRALIEFDTGEDYSAFMLRYNHPIDEITFRRYLRS